jgi:hypothetical protein
MRSSRRGCCCAFELPLKLWLGAWLDDLNGLEHISSNSLNQEVATVKFSAID